MNELTLRFRYAMARHLGQPLTPEIAAAIEVEAFTEPERGIDLEQFPPTVWGEYLIQLESFRAVLPELIPLHEAHWQETEKHRHGLALNPRYDLMAARERAGRLVQVTVRRHGVLAGHVRMYLGESEHTSTTYADEDTMYLLPEHRGGLLAMRMVRYTECVVQQLGALEVRANTKTVKGIDVLLLRLGYRHVANQYVKFIEKESAHV